MYYSQRNHYGSHRTIEMGLENRVALVTGATSEIGCAYVKRLLQNKVKVLLCDTNAEKCLSLAEDFAKQFKNVGVTSTKCDVTIEDEFENVFKTCIKQFGRLDIVVNNAGVFDYNSTERWSTTVNVNYSGVVRGTLLAIKYMGIPNGGNGGTVIQTTSLMAYSDGFRYYPMYKTTRKCVTQFTKSFGSKRNFGLHGVHIISLCPGFTGANHCAVATVDENEMANGNGLEHAEEMNDLHKQLIVQDPDHVGKALIEILKHGKTGETWIVEDNRPPRLVDT